MSVEAAVEEIIERTMCELRKSTFGDDMGDAKSLPWEREQAWTIVSRLALRDEVSRGFAVFVMSLHQALHADTTVGRYLTWILSRISPSMVMMCL